MAIKKFGEWCQKFNETGTGSAFSGAIVNKQERYGSALQNLNLNKVKINQAIEGFLTSFNDPAEQRMFIAELRKRLTHARDMFKTEEEVPE